MGHQDRNPQRSVSDRSGLSLIRILCLTSLLGGEPVPQAWHRDHASVRKAKRHLQRSQALWLPLGSFTKDRVENWLHKQICSDAMPPKEAQKGIATDWRQYVPRVLAAKRHRHTGTSPQHGSSIDSGGRLWVARSPTLRVSPFALTMPANHWMACADACLSCASRPGNAENRIVSEPRT